MAGINSRRKGKGGEKQCINFLRSWTKMDFASTPSSGGLRWGKAENVAGDVICIQKNYIFPIAIEVKFVKDINFEHLLYHKASKKEKRLVSRIEEFWMQCRRDARRAEKAPMLMMRYNGMPKDFFFIVMGQKLYRHIVGTTNKMIKPYLNYSKGVVITTSLALSKVDFKKVEQAAWTYINNRYGKRGS